MKDVTAEMERENRRAGAGRSRRKQKSARAFAGKGLVSGGIAVLTVVLAATGIYDMEKRKLCQGDREQPENSGQLVTVGEMQSSGTGEEKPILGGAELMMLSNQTKGQMMSFLIETKNGNLIVIDGGRWEDGRAPDGGNPSERRSCGCLVSDPYAYGSCRCSFESFADRGRR